jgi:hypothetical protein
VTGQRAKQKKALGCSFFFSTMAHHQQFVTKKQKKRREEEVEHVPLYCVVDGDAQKWSNVE